MVEVEVVAVVVVVVVAAVAAAVVDMVVAVVVPAVMAVAVAVAVMGEFDWCVVTSNKEILGENSDCNWCATYSRMTESRPLSGRGTRR